MTAEFYAVVNKYLIIICGPTASGKTNIAIQLANVFNTEIISADSRQFYREMNIGTAKPTHHELNQAKHHFVNSHSITEEFTVGDFEKQSLEVLEKLYETKNIAVLAGGSGLFINAVTNGFDNLPKAEPSLRKELNKQYQEKGIGYLQQRLKETDPTYYQEVDKNNPQRIIRALEVSITTGRPFSSFRTNEKTNRPFKTIKIGLNIERDKLYQRINDRVDEMIAAGLVEEVKSLIQFRNLNALQTVGYSELFDFLDNKITLSDAIDKIKQNTRRYAKRQLTWFRKDEEIKWFSPDDVQAIIDYIKKQIGDQA